MKIQYTNEMIDFIQDSPCSFLAVANVKENLDKKGFSCLDIVDKEIEKVANKDETLLVYCRSGVRSKQASQIMANMGYKNIYEFGGIIDWPFDIVM